MTTEMEKKFFKAFGIPKNVRKFRQYNFGQVPYGQQELKIIALKWVLEEEDD